MTEKSPFQHADYWQMKWLQGAEFSPDHSRILYTVTHHDAASDTDKPVIWMMDTASGNARQMTSGAHNDMAPHFSPDGKWIGFISDRGGLPQIYTMPVDGGEARALTKVEQGVREGPIWSPDGKWIAFTAGVKKEAMPDYSKPYRLTRNIYRFNEIGFIDAAVQQVYVMPAEGGEPKQLTQDERINAGIRWSPDSTRILFGAAFAPDSYLALAPVLKIVTLDGATQPLLEDWGMSMGAMWIDNQRLAITGNPHDKVFGSNNNLWVLDVQSGAIENRTPSTTGAVGGGLQADFPGAGLMMAPGMFVDGESLYCGIQDGGNVPIIRVALSGAESVEYVLNGDAYHILLGMSDGHLLYATTDFNAAPDLFIADKSGRNARRLTDLNGDLFASKQLGAVERLHWKSIDGQQVEGWYLRPAVGAAPYPTILYVHGGPAGGFGPSFSADFQLLNGAGYGVLLVNFRGSTGYGDAFGTAINGAWGNLDYHDNMTGVDHVIALGLADADRLGVCGLSYGGYETCWIIGQTDRFKAAIPENPVSNLVSLYLLSDIGIWILEQAMGGSYYDKPDVYVKSSPITYANRCKTPTLLVQCDADFRCPAEQSEQFYTALRSNGCTVEMLRLPGVGHGGAIMGPPAIRRAQNDAMLEWFNRYIPTSASAD
jgi:dipeptidyl aminopeptidase/acylaminoacyl peptidase